MENHSNMNNDLYVTDCLGGKRGDCSCKSSRVDETMVLYKGRRIPLNQLPWWRKDKLGWPIETFRGHPFHSFIRLICQNIRKITG